MKNQVDINFGDMPDREIAEHVYRAYGANLVRYAIKSWRQSEDDAWEILYETLYGFINSYSRHKFESEKQVGALVWKIFRNKLRDKLRREKRLRQLSGNNCETMDIEVLENATPDIDIYDENPILSKLDSILQDLNDWERQLLICRANDFPYKIIEDLTGQNRNFLKVHYQRLKKRISEKLELNPD